MGLDSGSRRVKAAQTYVAPHQAGERVRLRRRSGHSLARPRCLEHRILSDFPWLTRLATRTTSFHTCSTQEGTRTPTVQTLVPERSHGR